MLYGDLTEGLRMILRNAGVFAAVLAITGCTTPRQAIFDAEVDRLCALDGGTRVFEAVTLPADQFRKPGVPAFYWSSKGELALGPAYRVYDSEVVVKGAPMALQGATLVRHSFEVYRRSDNKLLGSSVRYVRKGGDLPLGGHPTSYACPSTNDQLFPAIFIPG